MTCFWCCLVNCSTVLPLRLATEIIFRPTVHWVFQIFEEGKICYFCWTTIFESESSWADSKLIPQSIIRSNKNSKETHNKSKKPSNISQNFRYFPIRSINNNFLRWPKNKKLYKSCCWRYTHNWCCYSLCNLISCLFYLSDPR